MTLTLKCNLLNSVCHLKSVTSLQHLHNVYSASRIPTPSVISSGKSYTIPTISSGKSYSILTTSRGKSHKIPTTSSGKSHKIPTTSSSTEVSHALSPTSAALVKKTYSGQIYTRGYLNARCAAGACGLMMQWLYGVQQVRVG